jgi:membrane associated rhomboid family serine protease
LVNERQPFFNVPGVVTAVLTLCIAMFAWLALSPEASADWWTLALGFIPMRYDDGIAPEIPGGRPAEATSFVTHMFVHASPAHLLLNGAWLLAFGGAVAKRSGTVRFLAFFLLCGIAGAATFLAFNPHGTSPMVGASGAISGMMGGTMRFLFSALEEGPWRLREAPREIPLMPLGKALRHPRVILTTVLWLGLNALAVLGFGGPDTGGAGIAWEAHVGGYIAGLLTFGWFDRPLPPREG